jgi:hypothetical protein
MVMYDSVNSVITAEVVVAQSAKDNAITISAPPVTISSGTWEVRWELMVSPAGLEAGFAKPGIRLGSLPRGVTLTAGLSGSELLWTARFKNDVETVDSLNYEIDIDSTSGVGPHKATLRVTRRNTTIVVVKDPVNPAPPPTAAT